MAAVERIPVHHHGAAYISFPLGSLGPLWYLPSSVYMSRTPLVLLMYTLEGVSSVAIFITAYEESR